MPDDTVDTKPEFPYPPSEKAEVRHRSGHHVYGYFVDIIRGPSGQIIVPLDQSIAIKNGDTLRITYSKIIT